MATSRRGRRGQLDKCSGLPADASSFVSRVPLDLARGQEGVSVCVTGRELRCRCVAPASSLETVDSLGQLRPRGFWRFSHGSRPWRVSSFGPKGPLLCCMCRLYSNLIGSGRVFICSYLFLSIQYPYLICIRILKSFFYDIDIHCNFIWQKLTLSVFDSVFEQKYENKYDISNIRSYPIRLHPYTRECVCTQRRS